MIPSATPSTARWIGRLLAIGCLARKCPWWLGFVLPLLALAACAGERERSAERALHRAARLRGQHRGALSRGQHGTAGAVDGHRAALAPDPHVQLERGVSAYVALALSQSPPVRAAFARWQAEVYRISRARRLPELSLGFGYFVTAVETRAGPQRARVSLQQAFPWPTKLSAGADAASARARAAEQAFDAEALTLASRVADAYWDLWELRQTRAFQREHLSVLSGLAQTVRGRLSVGQASLADQLQVDLSVARLSDAIAGLDERERIGEAALRSLVSLSGSVDVPTDVGPLEAHGPASASEQLRAQAETHPAVLAHGHLAEAHGMAAEAEAADRYPSFTLGADWIITGENPAAGQDLSGKDAVLVGAGIRLPLWQGSYGDAESAARADALAQQAERSAAIDRAHAQLAAAEAKVRDGVRRVHVLNDALLPQAEAAYESVLGAYASGRSSVAQALLSERDLLDLRIELLRARADYMRAWAELERVTGQPQEASAGSLDTPVSSIDAAASPVDAAASQVNGVASPSRGASDDGTDVQP